MPTANIDRVDTLSLVERLGVVRSMIRKARVTFSDAELAAIEDFDVLNQALDALPGPFTVPTDAGGNPIAGYEALVLIEREPSLVLEDPGTVDVILKYEHFLDGPNQYLVDPPSGLLFGKGRCSITEKTTNFFRPFGDPTANRVQIMVAHQFNMSPPNPDVTAISQTLGASWVPNPNATDFSLASFTIANTGQNYAVGDTLFLDGGTINTGPALLQVTAIQPNSNGAIAADGLAIIIPGDYTQAPDNPVLLSAQTGTGIGAQINAVFSSGAVPVSLPEGCGIQGGEISLPFPQANFQLVGIIFTANPWNIADEVIACVNSDPWLNKPPITWICSEVQWEMINPGPLDGQVEGVRAYRFMFEFQYNLDTWDPTVAFIDQRTGKPPANLEAAFLQDINGVTSLSLNLAGGPTFTQPAGYWTVPALRRVDFNAKFASVFEGFVPPQGN